MIIWENKIFDQFATAKHQKICLPTTKMKPTKCPAGGKKWGKKSENRGEERNLEILLSAHAWTLQANILHLDQKTVKCTVC